VFVDDIPSRAEESYTFLPMSDPNQNLTMTFLIINMNTLNTTTLSITVECKCG